MKKLLTILFILFSLPILFAQKSAEVQTEPKKHETNNKIQSMKNITVKPRFPGYAESGLDLQSVGGFHDIMNFFSVVTKMDRLVDFKTMEFDVVSSTEEGASVKFKALISIFSQMSPEQKEKVEPKP